MPTLRDMIEGRDLNFEASPLAKHVSNHMQDPVGATKKDFQNLTQKKLQYDQAREEAQRNLAPVQSIITHVSQLHNLQPNMPTPNMDMNPGNGMNPNMDPNDPNNPNPDPEELDEYGNPLNMQQTPGQMNVNRPSLVGHQPGVAPMNEGQVVPKKLGLAEPGGKQARNSPQPKLSNPQDMQYNKSAKPPKGSKKLPHAKGPGDPKVANRTKKAQDKSVGLENSVSRPIKISVHAASSIPDVTTVGDSLGFASLKFRADIKAAAGSMPIGPGGALGPSGVMPGNNPATGAPISTPGQASQGQSTGNVKGKGKKMKALDELSDKEPGNTQHQVALNPTTISGKGKTLDLCGKCGGMHAVGDCPKMKASGHSRGAKKGWSTRGKGHLSATEKASHYKTMDAREFSTKQRKKLAKTGAAMPGGGYPISNRQDLANAKQATGRAKNRAATIAHINQRAKALGAPGFGK